MDENQFNEDEELQIVEDPDYNPPPPIEEYPRCRLDDKPPRTLGMMFLGCFLWIVVILVVLYGTAALITVFDHIDKAAPLLGATLSVIGFWLFLSQFQRKN